MPAGENEEAGKGMTPTEMAGKPPPSVRREKSDGSANIPADDRLTSFRHTSGCLPLGFPDKAAGFQAGARLAGSVRIEWLNPACIRGFRTVSR